VGIARYKIIVGAGIATGYAGTYEQAKTLAAKYAARHRGYIVLALDTETGTTAFTCSARVDCPNCDN